MNMIEYIAEIEKIIIKHKILYFCDLIDEFLTPEKAELYITVLENTNYFDAYIRSRRQKLIDNTKE